MVKKWIFGSMTWGKSEFALGWIVELAGTALWLYGYFVTGHPALIDWQADFPWWVAKWLPNVESEVGLVMVLAGTVLMYWPGENNA